MHSNISHFSKDTVPANVLCVVSPRSQLCSSSDKAHVKSKGRSDSLDSRASKSVCRQCCENWLKAWMLVSVPGSQWIHVFCLAGSARLVLIRFLRRICNFNAAKPASAELSPPTIRTARVFLTPIGCFTFFLSTLGLPLPLAAGRFT